MLFGRRAGQGHEPVGVVGGAVKQRPRLQPLGDGIGQAGIEGFKSRDGAAEFAKDGLRQVLALGLFAEHVAAVDILAGMF